MVVVHEVRSTIFIHVVPESLLPAQYTLQDLIEDYNYDGKHGILLASDPEGRTLKLILFTLQDLNESNANTALWWHLTLRVALCL